jgi:hypothetical protein
MLLGLQKSTRKKILFRTLGIIDKTLGTIEAAMIFRKNFTFVFRKEGHYDLEAIRFEAAGHRIWACHVYALPASPSIYSLRHQISVHLA